MRHRRFLSLLLLAVLFGTLSLAAAGPVEPRELTFEQRVEAQQAIEQVYWSHRIWPAENHSIKPPLSAVMPAEAIRAKVADYLKKSNALAETWDRAITAQELQAEMERMARDTQRPEILREIFEALGNDPFVIAECLARPNVTDRLLRDAYARDERFHGQLRQAAEAVARDGSIDGMKIGGGEYRELTWRLVEEPSSELRVAGNTERGLNQEDWDEMLRGLRPSRGLPLRESSHLQQDDDAFWVTRVLAQGADFVKVATVTWSKTPLEAWWVEKRPLVGTALAAPAGAYALAAVRDGGCTDDTWTPTSGKVGAPVYSHSAVWTGTEMIAWGGESAYNAYVNTGARYNPATDTLTTTSTGTNVPSARSGHTAVWTGTEMIAWGGQNGTSKLNTGGRYDPSTDAWSPTNTIASPAARTGGTAVWTGSVMVVWGGTDGVAYFNTGGRYDPSSNTWTTTSTGTSVPQARASHCAVWTGTTMIVWGGTNGALVFITGGRYNPATDTWLVTSTGTNRPAARWNATAVWTGSVMIVWGGQGAAGFLDTGGRYDPAANTWAAMSTSPTARSGHTAVWTGTKMIVWGGLDTWYTNTGGLYDPTTNTWTPTSTGANAPGERYKHTAVWTGAEMIVWGGSDDDALNSGGRYNPSTDTWAKTNLYQPGFRNFATSVWTGAEMIVWGGTGTVVNNPIFNAGGRYDPITDTFAPTSRLSAPPSRADHSAVWTGSEMIVWGGYDYWLGLYLNSGGRYNPSTDSWLLTDTGANLPGARYLHSAIWNGSEMIVWGGASFNTSTENTGGRFKPSTNSWTPVSTSNSPAGRHQHTAVWTGTEMIVWGGQNGSGQYFNTGGRYAPGTDTWTATSTGEDVPVARYAHTAVWTGNVMVVWGGYATSQFNTGGLYSPSTDTWKPTSMGANVPSVRAGHTAVWTGTEMLAWGGYDGSAAVNTGGRYEPLSDSWRSTSTGTNVPSAKSGHEAVWTGTEMIVWGGSPERTVDVDRYCAVCPTTTWYRDADGDGYGVGADVVLECSQPEGYVAIAGDCNDASATSHPGAVELCDGLDNNCDTLVDNVALPGTVADVVEAKPGGVVTISWTSPSGAQFHDVVRGQLGTLRATGGDFTASMTDCLANDVAGTSANDPDTPALGDGFWHLVRASNCVGPGTYDDGTSSQSGARDAEIAASGSSCP